MFAYCKKHMTSMIVFDPNPKDFSNIIWDSVDWSEFYPDAVKLGRQYLQTPQAHGETQYN